MNIMSLRKARKELKLSDDQLKEFCEHIINEPEKYMPERVFDAKETLKQLGGNKND